MRSLILWSVLAATPVFAANSEIYSQLKKEIPEGTHFGKQHDGKACQIIATERSDGTYGAIYQITSFFQDSEHKMVFELRKNKEVFSQKSYVGKKVKPETGEMRTNVTVGRGPKMKSTQTYWEGYEKEITVGIKVMPKQRGFKGPAWRIFVGAMNAGKIGFGGQTCHIEPLTE